MYLRTMPRTQSFIIFLQLLNHAERLLHALEKYAASIGLYVNPKKTEAMNFNQANNIMIKAANGNPLKNVDSFVYLGSEISSTEKDIKIRIAKAWSALNKMQVI